MPEGPYAGRRDLERDKGQELLDELHGINEGLNRLAAAVEDLDVIMSEATGIELEDESGEDDIEPRSESGLSEAFSHLGSIIVEALRESRRKRGPG